MSEGGCVRKRESVAPIRGDLGPHRRLSLWTSGPKRLGQTTNPRSRREGCGHGRWPGTDRSLLSRAVVGHHFSVDVTFQWSRAHPSSRRDLCWVMC